MNMNFSGKHLGPCCALAVALSATACGKSSSPPSTVEAGVSSPSATPSAAVVASASAPAQAPSGPMLPNVGVANRMANEANNRPTGTPRAEDVYAALAKAGMKLVEKNQHMAAPFGAQYCLGAEVEGQLALSVCEYGSEQAAKDGREMSLKAFKFVANREIFVNKQTTFTVREKTKTPEVDAVAKRAQQLFAGLKGP